MIEKLNIINKRSKGWYFVRKAAKNENGKGEEMKESKKWKKVESQIESGIRSRK